MNDQQQSSQAPAPNPGFVIPTNSPEGATLTTREQFETMRKNESWARDALIDGTQARQQLNDFNLRLAEEQGATDEQDPATHDAPVKSPNDYELPLTDDGSMPVAEFEQIQTTSRQWLFEAGFSPTDGATLARRIDELSRQAPRWTDAEAMRQQNTSWETLERLHGGTAQLEAKLKLAHDFINAVNAKSPGLKALFDAAPYLLDDAQIVHQIIQAAEARAARRG